MNQAISKILTEGHVHTRMHTASHFIIIIITVKIAAKNSNVTYSVQERKRLYKHSCFYNMLVAPYLLKKTKVILTIIFKWSFKL